MKKYRLFFTLLFVGLAQSPVFGEVSLNRTRLIVTESSKETSVQVINEGKYPVLIQSWIDLGENNLAPESIVAPFLVTVPMFRLEPKGARLLRILLIDRTDQLPANKESVFWLNVQEIPPNIAPDPSASLGKEERYMQIAFRTRIKLFYRPQKVAANQTLFHQQLRFALVEQNGERFLQVQNPTPIHITLPQIALGADREHPVLTLNPPDGMVRPQSTRLFPLPDTRALSEKEPVYYQFIDDYGQSVEGQQALGNAAN